MKNLFIVNNNSFLKKKKSWIMIADFQGKQDLSIWKIDAI